MALRKSIANGQVKLAELGLERFKAALTAEARQSAYELLAAQQLSDSAQEVATRGQDLLGVLLQRDPTGIAPLLETRIIEASIITLQKRALDTDLEAQKALFKLNQLMGSRLTSDVRITSYELQLPPIPPVDDLLATALEANFELRAKREELKAQGFRVELAKNERYPAFKVGPFYSEERASEKEQVFGLGVSVPLPLWNQNDGNIAAASARESQARTSIQLAELEVERSIREHAFAYERGVPENQRWRSTIGPELEEAGKLGKPGLSTGNNPMSTF